MGAILSSDGRYRFLLTRQWGNPSRVAFVMLNPSTADAELDDPTIRRCRGFAEGWGYGALDVVNLFPYRATKPAALLDLTPEELNGDVSRHLSWVATTLGHADLIVGAWGAGYDRIAQTVVQSPVLDLLGDHLLHRIGPPTKYGEPRHPLYLPKNAPLESMSPAPSPEGLTP
jgi:hypothetical protein